MPMPWTCRQASREWRAFLDEVRAAMDLTSDNAACTSVEGVLRAFRRRLTPQQAVDFAQVLPAVLRALFVANWRLAEGRCGQAAARTGPPRRWRCGPTIT